MAGRFQIRLGDSWRDFDEAENQQLLQGVAAGKSRLQVESRLQLYEYGDLQNLQNMQQTNLTTGRKRAVRFVAWAPRPAGGLAKPEKPPSEVRDWGEQYKAQDMPQCLHMWVPSGPTFVSGAYHLVRDQQYNGYPVWCMAESMLSPECWIYSTPDEHWAIGTVDECGSSGTVWVYCPNRHFGQTPESLPRTWQHSQPAWTIDRSITVTAVDEDDVSTLADADSSVDSWDFGRRACTAAAGCGVALGVVGGAVLAGDALWG